MPKVGKTRRMADLARQKAQERAGRKTPGKTLPRALRMAQAYESVLGEYLHRPGLRYLGVSGAKLDPKRQRANTMFESAARLADEEGANYEDWVRAQFYWIHQWFGRPAKLYELQGQKGQRPAKYRYNEWLSIVGRGAGVTGKVSSIVQETATVGESEVDKINKKRLERLMEAYDLSEEDALVAFAPEGVFDPEWLSVHPPYLALREAGKA
jgi:hypothetical protein